MSVHSAAPWAGLDRPAPRRRFTWNALLWALVFPQRGQRIVPTLPGTLLIALSLGVGTAAYNSANNILFITLSLMLACLILSGVLSWLNFRGLHWRLEVAPPLRVGQAAIAALELRNRKGFLPTYGLWFDFVARVADQGPPAVAESTITGRGLDVRAILAKAEAAEARGQLLLRERLDARGEARLEWSFTPSRRGRLSVELTGLGSLFPFGFLRKTLSLERREERVVWPAVVDYRRLPAATERMAAGGGRAPRVGSGGDLLALRRYAAGDSHRLIHWKASARSQQLLVRQFSAESMEEFSLWLQTEAARWPKPEQFELAVSLCATLAEDLFRAGQLGSATVADEAPLPIRQVRDLERFLDRLAEVQIADGEPGVGSARGRSESRRNRLTFVPDGTRGVAALLDGKQAATA